MSSDDENDTLESTKSPQEYIMSTLKSMGIPVQIKNSLELEDFFVAPTEEEISHYSHDVITAIRNQNVDQLREFHENGRPLKSSNRFGESLLHMACRRGFLEVASFLINEAGVTVQVRDDYGRTPMHDACWTTEPNFELLEMLMRKCPSLLFLKDRRGHAPLQYARKEHWKSYIQFLSQRHELFATKFTT
jgi:ankyrin repeat protein